MKTNPFSNSEPFSFKNSVQYSDGAIVSKRVLGKPAGNVSLFAFDAGQCINEHSALHAKSLFVPGTCSLYVICLY